MMELLYKAGGHFNPHSHEGSDDIRFVSVKFGNIFQSTLPRRERQQTSKNDVDTICISIHTPTKGAT